MEDAAEATAETAATIAGFLALGWTIPADLERCWGWFAAGHWPCDVDRTGDARLYKLRVLQAELKVTINDLQKRLTNLDIWWSEPLSSMYA
ncbi:hypothetical protein [Dactylosporangium sp. NPDC048998]|uniref:hypothetical protein n=1 Tax=Dactylosporangium sp. NPDC048998 TaxID=3363976 RepID=UPI003711712F